MVSLTRSRAQLELGRRLVNDLEVGDDLLASWMAHYIARLMDAAENAGVEAKEMAEGACAKAILELWNYRNALPGRFRPLRDFEPVLRTLSSLDSDSTQYRYYDNVLQEAAAAHTNVSTRRWLDFSVEVDYVARLLIRSALRTAASNVAAKTESWISLAVEAGASEVDEEAIFWRVMSEDEANEKKPSALQHKLARLETFMEMTKLLIEDVKGELASSEIDTTSKPA